MMRNAIRAGRAGARILAVACTALLVTGTGRAMGQTLSTGVITGSVVDSTNTPVNGVVITITNRSSGQRSYTRADRLGFYASDPLDPGHYDVLYEQLGWAPLRATDVVVEAAVRRELIVTLARRSEPLRTLEVSGATTARSSPGRSGPDRWLVSGRNLAAMPFEGAGLEALKQISSLTGYRGDINGLPGHMVTVSIDGIALAQRPDPLSTLMRNSAIPLAYLSQVTLRTSSVDPENPALSAGHLSAFYRRGGRASGVTGYGDFSSDATSSGTAAVESFTSYRAGGLVQGAIISDTATFIAGAEVQRSFEPYEALWTGTSGTDALVSAANSQYGVDLSGFRKPSLASFDRQTAFGRLDFRFSGSAGVTVRGLFSRIMQPEPVAPWTGSPLGSTITPDQQDIFTSATLTTRIDDDLLGEVNIGFESSKMTQRPAAERGDALAGTHVVSASRNFGSTLLPDENSSMNTIYFRGTLHIESGRHFRKIGLMGLIPTYHLPYNSGRVGEYTFGNVTDFGDGFGLFRRVEGEPARADMKFRSVGVFAQDVWLPSPGVQVHAGGRITSFRLPDSTDFNIDAGWERLTGINYRETLDRRIEFEPRFSIELNPVSRPEWRLDAGVAIDAQQADPGAVAELISNFGVLDVRSGFGALGRWPTGASQPPAQINGATLTVFGPHFRGPRTTRAHTGVEYAGGPGVIKAAFSYRKTEFLPERINLNGTGVVTSYDQHGRPLFGTLAKRAQLLYAVEGSNRRFAGYADVWGLQSTATSKASEFTISAERNLSGPVGFFGSYTWSRTTDDWLYGDPADPFTQIAPFPDSLVSEPWQYGVSDFDIPHRVVAGAEIVLPVTLSPRLSGLFRYQSGYPFTPGYKPGVDANADGSGRNDPAFIDPAVSGMQQLLSEWPCLDENQGKFAARNSCRGPSVKTLDARLTLSWRGPGRTAADIVIDALNLLTSDAGIVDAAVYTVDPAAALDQAGSVVTVPLLANPDFGQLLSQLRAQRQLRVGLRVSF